MASVRNFNRIDVNCSLAEVTLAILWILVIFPPAIFLWLLSLLFLCLFVICLFICYCLFVVCLFVCLSLFCLTCHDLVELLLVAQSLVVPLLSHRDLETVLLQLEKVLEKTKYLVALHPSLISLYFTGPSSRKQETRSKLTLHSDQEE